MFGTGISLSSSRRLGSGQPPGTAEVKSGGAGNGATRSVCEHSEYPLFDRSEHGGRLDQETEPRDAAWLGTINWWFRLLVPGKQKQVELFASRGHAISEAIDRINDRWGEFVVTPALIMGMEGIILDRISFAGVKELRQIYE